MAIGTKVVNVAPSVRAAGTYTFAAPQPVPSNLRTATLEINLSDADKLAVGNVVDISSEFSTDGGTTWTFANGTTWNSYGPDGLTVTDPDGTVRVNPDPRIQIPLATRAGQRVRLKATLNNTMTAGVTLAVI